MVYNVLKEYRSTGITGQPTTSERFYSLAVLAEDVWRGHTVVSVLAWQNYFDLGDEDRAIDERVLGCRLLAFT